MAEDFLSYKLDAATAESVRPQVIAKLTSVLDAEPDDDFFSYTMLLVQNGRSKQYIAKDLETFLESPERASQFADWLWDLLEDVHAQRLDAAAAAEETEQQDQAAEDEDEQPQEDEEEEQTITVTLGGRVGSVATVPRPNPSQQRTVASVVVPPANSDTRKRSSASAGMPAARKLLQSAVSQSLESTGKQQRGSVKNAPASSSPAKRQKVIVRRDGSAMPLTNNGNSAPIPRPKVVRKVNNMMNNNNNNGMGMGMGMGMPMHPHGGPQPFMGLPPGARMNMGGPRPNNFPPFHPQPLMVSFDARAPNNNFNGGFDGTPEWEVPLNRPPPRPMMPPQPSVVVVPAPRMLPQQQFFNNQGPNHPQQFFNQPQRQQRPPIIPPQQQQQQQPPAADGSGSKKVKCTFFPNCTKGAACPFYHPTEVCRFFPNCTFGDACLNIHPSAPCKFGLKCTNAKCTFSHPPKRKAPTATASSDASSPSDPNAIPCRWGAKCTREDCKFQHPKERNLDGDMKFPENAGSLPCKFDPSCKRIRCPFLHPKRDALDQSFLEDAGAGQKTASLSSSLPSTPPDLKHGANQLDPR